MNKLKYIVLCLKTVLILNNSARYYLLINIPYPLSQLRVYTEVSTFTGLVRSKMQVLL